MISMTDDQKKNMLAAARKAMADKLGIDCPAQPDLSDGVFNEQYGIFVTVHKFSQLRGCIGYVKGERPLRDAVNDMAISAAFRDPRFPELTAAEYDEIDIEISVLSPLEEVDSLEEIEVGTHGLVITRGYHSGLLLPQVAVEQNWDRFSFIQNACYKAGLPHDAWQQEDTVIEKFSALVFGEKDLSSGTAC